MKELDDNVAALEHPTLAPDELAEIDRHASDAGINLWKWSSEQ